MGVTVNQHADVTVTCDGPRCVGPKGNGPTVYQYDEEDVKKDPAALPDGMARIIQVIVDPLTVHGEAQAPGKKLIFCRPRCNHDYFDYAYVAPKSPRELMQEAQANKAVEDAHKEMAISVEAAVGGGITSQAAGLGPGGTHAE